MAVAEAEAASEKGALGINAVAWRGPIKRKRSSSREQAKGEPKSRRKKKAKSSVRSIILFFDWCR